MSYIKESASLWKYVMKRNIVDEKELSKSTKKCLDLMELLLDVGLERTVLNLGPY